MVSPFTLRFKLLFYFMQTKTQQEQVMIIRTAAHLGMCFGVRDAISAAKRQAAQGSLTVLGDLVHNPGVNSELKRRGIKTTRHYQNAQSDSVMITAHGTSNNTRRALEASPLRVYDATCPLVHHAHRELETLVAKGCFPIIIGVEGHVEVTGLVGDLEDYRILISESDFATVPTHPHFGIVAQTTQPLDRVRSLVAAFQATFPEAKVEFRDTICQPTKNRQRAARSLAEISDVMIVIGGKHSNNTHELVAVCSKHCDQVHHVQEASDLMDCWFQPGDEIGITAGTSTPEDQIQSVIQHLENLAHRTPSRPAQSGAEQFTRAPWAKVEV